jgi:hypothetical protein
MPCFSIRKILVMTVTTWLLARARAYILAVASKLEQDVAISLDVSSLHVDAASLAWLREVPAEYSSSMPINGRWLAYCDQDVITYYRGSLAEATIYSMHIYKPCNHLGRLDKESAYAVLCDQNGTPVTRSTLYFWNLEDPGDRRNSIKFMGPGGLEMLV